MKFSTILNLSAALAFTLLAGCGSGSPTSTDDPKPSSTPPKVKADIYSKNEAEALEAFNSGYRTSSTATKYALTVANDLRVVTSVRRAAIERVKAKFSVSLADETSVLDNNSEWPVYDSLYPILFQRLTPLLPRESKEIIMKAESPTNLAVFSSVQKDPMSMELALASKELFIEGLEKKWFRHRFIYQAVMNRESIETKFVTDFEVFKWTILQLKEGTIVELEKDVLGPRPISKSEGKFGPPTQIQTNSSWKEIANITQMNRLISRGEIEILSLLVSQAPRSETSRLIVTMLSDDISWLVPNLSLQETTGAEASIESVLEFNRRQSVAIVKSLPYSPELLNVYGMITVMDGSSESWALANFKESLLSYVKTTIEKREDKLNVPQESGIFIRKIEFKKQPQRIFWLLDSIQTFCPYAQSERACLTSGAKAMADTLVALNDLEYSAIASEAVLFSMGSSFVASQIQEVKIKVLARALSVDPATLRAAQWKFGPAVTNRKLSLFPHHINTFGFVASASGSSMSETLMELGITFVNQYPDLISIGEVPTAYPDSGRVDRPDREVWDEGVFRAVSLGQDPLVIVGLTYCSHFPEHFRDANRLDVIRVIAKDANRSIECRKAAEEALKKIQVP